MEPLFHDAKKLVDHIGKLRKPPISTTKPLKTTSSRTVVQHEKT